MKIRSIPFLMAKLLFESDKPRVVLDSNVWISALIFGGNPGKILELFIEGEILVYFCEELITEIHRKVVQKFPQFMPRLGLLELSIRRDANLVRLGSITVLASRDQDDNKVLETAVLSSCGYVISGDKDLLVLGRYKEIQIVSPTEFLSMYNRA